MKESIRLKPVVHGLSVSLDHTKVRLAAQKYVDKVVAERQPAPKRGYNRTESNALERQLVDIAEIDVVEKTLVFTNERAIETTIVVEANHPIRIVDFGRLNN